MNYNIFLNCLSQFQNSISILNNPLLQPGSPVQHAGWLDLLVWVEDKICVPQPLVPVGFGGVRAFPDGNRNEEGLVFRLACQWGFKVGVCTVFTPNNENSAFSLCGHWGEVRQDMLAISGRGQRFWWLNFHGWELPVLDRGTLIWDMGKHLVFLEKLQCWFKGNVTKGKGQHSDYPLCLYNFPHGPRKYVQYEFLKNRHYDITHNKLTAQKPTSVLTEVIWEQQRKGRQWREDTWLCQEGGHSRCEEVEVVLPIIKNSQSKACHFN